MPNSESGEDPLTKKDAFRDDKDISFWDGIARSELRIKKCNACGIVLSPGALFCSECWSGELTAIKASGRGRVHSFVVYHRAFSENETPPYNAAIIALEEGPRIVSVVDGSDRLQVGNIVEAVWSSTPAQCPALRFAVVDDADRKKEN